MHWWDVLEAVRRVSLAGERPFTSMDVAREAGIKATERSSPERIASAWLGKFQRWGYIVQKGTAEGAKRWIRTYTITKYGLERPAPGPAPEWKAKKK